MDIELEAESNIKLDVSITLFGKCCLYIGASSGNNFITAPLIDLIKEEMCRWGPRNEWNDDEEIPIEDLEEIHEKLEKIILEVKKHNESLK